MNGLIEELRKVVGGQYCLAGADARKKYDNDITGVYKGRSLAVVRPANTDEVSRVMALANKARVPVVPLSGNTGLAGGGYAGEAADTIILSLERMNRVREINSKSRLAIVESGVILANLHAAVDAHDLVFPLLFGARGSCMIGGNLATNAGGSNVVRYGNTRALCLGLEVVMPDGEIVNLMSELHKDNTGYDLKDLFIGSEGTLGVITAAVLKLFSKPAAYASAMVAAPNIAGALTLLHRIQAASGNGVEAFEYMPRAYFEMLQKVDPKAPMPFKDLPEVGIFIEIAATLPGDATPAEDGSLPVVTRLEDTLAALLETGEVLDATIARTEAQRLEMWRQREMAFEVSTHMGMPITTDVAVPLDKVGEFLHQADARLAEFAAGAKTIVVAHLGDGNLHYSILVDPQNPGAADAATRTAIYTLVEDVVADLHGSFSAEHGIGLAKKGTMARRKDKPALAVMAAIKAALDPNNIMNPGKLLP